MKNWISNLTKTCTLMAGILIIQIYTGCTPEKFEGGLGPAPTSEEVKITATPNSDNPNIVTFTNETPGTITAAWDLGNGEAGTGSSINGSYAVAGDYTVTLTVFTSGGYATNTQTVHIAETNVSMLNRDDYNMLTGGAGEANGKTWVVENDAKGHLGVGPSTTNTPDWWAAGINEKTGVGIYDDEMTFNLNGFAYTYNNNGDSYSNWASVAGIGGTTTGQDDATVSYTPPTGMNWSITEDGGKKYLSISKGGFIAYYTGVSKYQILSQSDDEMYLRFDDGANAGNAWYIKLKRKGYTVPVVAKPVKAADIFDNFDDAGNVTWQKEALSLNESYDNPAPVAPNTSSKVALYVKQDGQPYEFANMYADFDYKFDLTQRHIFKIKVFIPGYNDFTTALGEDWANKNLLKQVSIKLQDGTIAAPYTTQYEVKQQAETDKWVELTFDFSGAVDRKDFDRIVIQVGGEGNFIPGVFFLDDFRLEQ